MRCFNKAAHFLRKKGVQGVDYKKMYFELYAQVSDIIEKLQEIQKKYEEVYIEQSEKSQED